ncbi:MAG: hypothetical protein QOD84_1094 [Acidobacteriaceae bacterium]|jgi:hypothetical protein
MDDHLRVSRVLLCGRLNLRQGPMVLLFRQP